MKLAEMQTEEAKALLNAGVGTFIFLIIKIIFRINDYILLMWAAIVIIGAYLLDAAEKKYGILDNVRSKNK